jgi:AbrB family looped-hinge helix DNA binding protein
LSAQSSRLTKKFQTTIPRLIREKLGLKSGDLVRFELRNGEAILSKETTLDLAFLQAVEAQMEEWSSEADEEAYGDL